MNQKRIFSGKLPIISGSPGILVESIKLEPRYPYFSLPITPSAEEINQHQLPLEQFLGDHLALINSNGEQGKITVKPSTKNFC